MGKLTFKAAAVTDAGIVRKVNEDAYICRIIDAGEHYAGIFAVADGVGGLQKGEVASLTAVSNVNQWWETLFREHYHDKTFLQQSLENVFQLTNDDLLQFGNKHNIKLATTMSALFLYKNRYRIVHTGDSRIYVCKGGIFAKCRQLTHDHTYPVQKEANGRIIYKQVLTDCLGSKKTFLKTITEDKIEKKDLFLICSDGIYKTLNLNTIQLFVRKYHKNPERLCRALVEQVKKNGETDNISVIAVKIDEQKGNERV